MDSIAEYIARDRPMAASHIAERLQEAANLLTDQPTLGRSGRVPGTREFIVSGTPFIIPYRITDETIEILTVLHAARKWPEQF